MIIIDIETTGIDPKKHSIVSIAAIDFSNPQRQFYIENQISEDTEIYEGNDILNYKPALEINGFTLEQIKDKTKPTLKEAITKLFEFAAQSNDKLIAGINPYFDLDFIKQSAKISGIPFSFDSNAVDIKTQVYFHKLQRGINSDNIKSDDCFIYVGLESEKIPHNALFGVKLKAEALSRLVKGKGLFEEFAKYKIPDYLKK